MKRLFTILFTTILFSNTVSASKFFTTLGIKSDTVTIDSTHFVRHNGVLIPVNTWTPIGNDVTFRDTMFYRPMFLPIVFDGQILPTNLNFLSNRDNINTSIAPNFHILPSQRTFLPNIQQNNWMHSVRKDYFLKNISMLRYSAFSFKEKLSIYNQSVLSPSELTQNIRGELSGINTNIDVEKYIPGRIYWSKEGEHSLQINQNQYSNNWYAGGYNNFSVLNYHKIILNYKRDKVSWNNTFEWKLNFQRMPADTVHKLNISEDYLRTYTVVGISLSKKWSYTLLNEIKTSLFNKYKINSSARTGAIFSPLIISTGLGLTYNLTKTSKVDKYRKLTLSMDLSPISLNYVYVNDKEVDETKFGIESGKKAKLDIGSTYNVNLTYIYNKNSKLTSRLKYFTSYSKVIVESENRFNFAFTRLLSSSIYLYLRYDDGVAFSKKDDKLGYLQYNELIGFGLNYKW